MAGRLQRRTGRMVRKEMFEDKNFTRLSLPYLKSMLEEVAIELNNYLESGEYHPRQTELEMRATILESLIFKVELEIQEMKNEE